METVRLVLRYSHFISWAALIGGTLTQFSVTNKKAHPVALFGGRLAFVSGLLLVVVKEMIAAAGGDPVNHTKVVAKLVLALVPVMLLEVNAKKGLNDPAFWGTLGGSALAMGVAVFWI
jgi:hypothetical protein